MKRGNLDWFKWYIEQCWQSEEGGHLAETHLLALNKIIAELEKHKRRTERQQAAAERRFLKPLSHLSDAEQVAALAERDERIRQRKKNRRWAG